MHRGSRTSCRGLDSFGCVRISSESDPERRTDLLSHDIGRLRRARWLRRLFLATVALFVVLGAFNVFGVRTSTATAHRRDWRLAVEYPSVNRGGLPAPFSIRVTRSDGFTGSVKVTVASGYLSLFDDNGLDPDPDSSVSGDGYVEWTFEPPDGGGALVVTLDARIEPGRRGPIDGWVEVSDDAGPGPKVEFRTWIAP